MALTNENGAASNDVLAKLTEILSRLVDSQPVKKVSFAKYDPKTTFHPNKKETLTLTREWYQNGRSMRPENMFNAEIALLNQITRPGRYLNRLIEVVARDNGSDFVMELRYKNKGIDERLAHRSTYRNLQDMLQQIVDEQNAILNKEADDAAALAELKRSIKARPVVSADAKVLVKEKTDKAARQALEDVSNLNIDRP